MSANVYHSCTDNLAERVDGWGVGGLVSLYAHPSQRLVISRLLPPSWQRQALNYNGLRHVLRRTAVASSPNYDQAQCRL